MNTKGISLHLKKFYSMNLARYQGNKHGQTQGRPLIMFIDEGYRNNSKYAIFLKKISGKCKLIHELE